MPLSTTDTETTLRAPGETVVRLPDFAPELKRPSVRTYWRTARHMRWSQVFWLGRQRVRGHTRRILLLAPGPVRLKSLPQSPMFPEWQPYAARHMIRTGRFDFLNFISGDERRIPWSSRTLPRLWVYHLNYCDFLNLDLTQPEDRPVLRKALKIMVDWCAQNSTGREVGWEPYPLSLRTVNWLKFLLRNASRLEAIGQKTTVTDILASLGRQVLVLERTLEFHLRANHLLKNIKALMFAGALLETFTSDRWWARGAKLLGSQLEEQILPDGGHIERSMMYHGEVLEDLLDLENLVLASGRSLGCVSLLSKSIERMADFLKAMLHPDGEISLFNDSARGIAPVPRELFSRAGRNVPAMTESAEEIKILPVTGYAVMREHASRGCLILDCGPVGPDYQPGHAHCDVLSYELSLDRQRVVVDTGTSTYEAGPQRHYERSTAAHNTIRIDSEEQAEMWASFRVGRRPKIGPIESGQINGFRFVRGSHYGYRHLGVIHSREIVLSPEDCWVIVDSLRGSGTHRIESFVHFHPGVRVKACADMDTPLSGELQKRLQIDANGHRCFFLSSSKGTVELKDAWYSPEFGRREKQIVVYWSWQGALPVRLVYAFAPASRRTPRISLQADRESIEIDKVRIPLS